MVVMDVAHVFYIDVFDFLCVRTSFKDGTLAPSCSSGSGTNSFGHAGVELWREKLTAVERLAVSRQALVNAAKPTLWHAMSGLLIKALVGQWDKVAEPTQVIKLKKR